MIHDLIIIGGGPAGCAAAVYAARKQLKTLFLTESFGGQSIVSDDIQNWIGEVHIAGTDLAKKLETHVRGYADMVDIRVGERAEKIREVRCRDKNSHRLCDFAVTTKDKETFEGKAVIITTGASRRKLGVPGEKEFDGKGVSYCSTCDAPLFRGRNVAVVGGGNAGLEAAIDLLPYAKKIYLLQRNGALKGDPKTQERVRSEKQITILYNAETVKILGEKMIAGLVYRDLKTNKEKTLAVGGVFVEIGSVPNSGLVKNLVKLDRAGQIVIDAKHASTSRPGIFAAGDVTDDPYKQNNISVGDGVRAALAAYNYILERKKLSPAVEK